MQDSDSNKQPYPKISTLHGNRSQASGTGRSTRAIQKSSKLDDVCYDIRGPILSEAHRMEEEGHRILKLNIGNPTPFGFETPEEILRDVIHNLPSAQGYCESKGIFSARKAIMQDCQSKGFPPVDIEDIFIGNGVSELIQMAMLALLDTGDEILLPAPDYPLWTACVALSGGHGVHYRCEESNAWEPDLDDLRSKITSRTRGIVVINPNNPTGAVYSPETLRELVDIARQHGLILFADEIYDRILFDGAVHTPLASLAPDLLTITFNGLSKAYRAAGFRTGWMILSGAKSLAKDYIEGLEILASMRLCSNVPTQYAIQTALGGYQSVQEYLKPGGLWLEQRNLAHRLLNQIDGVSCVLPRGALYLFPKLNVRQFNLTNDESLVLDLLREEKILLVQGSAFNWPDPDHLRIVFLPREDDLSDAIERFERFLGRYRQA